jgi:hypothetical protein
MQRLRFIARNPRRLVPVVAALALATSASVNRPNRLAAAHPAPLSSKDGSAIVRANGMTPGDARTQSVTITNRGDGPGRFTLSEADVTHAEVAPYSGRLDSKLTIQVLDMTHSAQPIEIVAGGTPFGRLPVTPLGAFVAGETRTYAFIVTFPSGGVPTGPYEGDNDFQGSSASATLRWSATA